MKAKAAKAAAASPAGQTAKAASRMAAATTARVPREHAKTRGRTAATAVAAGSSDNNKCSNSGQQQLQEQEQVYSLLLYPALQLRYNAFLLSQRGVCLSLIMPTLPSLRGSLVQQRLKKEGLPPPLFLRWQAAASRVASPPRGGPLVSVAKASRSPQRDDPTSPATQEVDEADSRRDPYSRSPSVSFVSSPSPSLLSPLSLLQVYTKHRWGFSLLLMQLSLLLLLLQLLLLTSTAGVTWGLQPVGLLERSLQPEPSSPCRGAPSDSPAFRGLARAAAADCSSADVETAGPVGGPPSVRGPQKSSHLPTQGPPLERLPAAYHAVLHKPKHLLPVYAEVSKMAGWPIPAFARTRPEGPSPIRRGPQGPSKETGGSWASAKGRALGIETPAVVIEAPVKLSLDPRLHAKIRKTIERGSNHEREELKDTSAHKPMGRAAGSSSGSNDNAGSNNYSKDRSSSDRSKEISSADSSKGSSNSNSSEDRSCSNGECSTEGSRSRKENSDGGSSLTQDSSRTREDSSSRSESSSSSRDSKGSSRVSAKGSSGIALGGLLQPDLAGYEDRMGRVPREETIPAPVLQEAPASVRLPSAGVPGLHMSLTTGADTGDEGSKSKSKKEGGSSQLCADEAASCSLSGSSQKESPATATKETPSNTPLSTTKVKASQAASPASSSSSVSADASAAADDQMEHQRSREDDRGGASSSQEISGQEEAPATLPVSSDPSRNTQTQAEAREDKTEAAEEVEASATHGGESTAAHNPESPAVAKDTTAAAAAGHLATAADTSAAASGESQERNSPPREAAEDATAAAEGNGSAAAPPAATDEADERSDPPESSADSLASAEKAATAIPADAAGASNPPTVDASTASEEEDSPAAPDPTADKETLHASEPTEAANVSPRNTDAIPAAADLPNSAALAATEDQETNATEEARGAVPTTVATEAAHADSASAGAPVTAAEDPNSGAKPDVPASDAAAAASADTAAEDSDTAAEDRASAADAPSGAEEGDDEVAAHNEVETPASPRESPEQRESDSSAPPALGAAPAATPAAASTQAAAAEPSSSTGHKETHQKTEREGPTRLLQNKSATAAAEAAGADHERAADGEAPPADTLDASDRDSAAAAPSPSEKANQTEQRAAAAAGADLPPRETLEGPPRITPAKSEAPRAHQEPPNEAAGRTASSPSQGPRGVKAASGEAQETAAAEKLAAHSSASLKVPAARAAAMRPHLSPHGRKQDTRAQKATALRQTVSVAAHGFAKSHEERLPGASSREADRSVAARGSHHRRPPSAGAAVAAAADSVPRGHLKGVAISRAKLAASGKAKEGSLPDHAASVTLESPPHPSKAPARVVPALHAAARAPEGPPTVVLHYCVLPKENCMPDVPGSLGSLQIAAEPTLKLDLTVEADWDRVAKAISQWIEKDYFHHPLWGSLVQRCLVMWQLQHKETVPARWTFFSWLNHQPTPAFRHAFLDLYYPVSFQQQQQQQQQQH
ncbi:hypothetical protein Emed_007464 [Eimeria media]